MISLPGTWRPVLFAEGGLNVMSDRRDRLGGREKPLTPTEAIRWKEALRNFISSSARTKHGCGRVTQQPFSRGERDWAGIGSWVCELVRRQSACLSVYVGRVLGL